MDNGIHATLGSKFLHERNVLHIIHNVQGLSCFFKFIYLKGIHVEREREMKERDIILPPLYFLWRLD